MRTQRLACSASVTLRKSGIWQTSQSSRVPATPRRRSRTSGMPASSFSVARSSASRARCRSGWSAGASRLAISDSGVAKSSAELRHCRRESGRKRWFSIASTTSGSSGGASPVTPNVPSEV